MRVANGEPIAIGGLLEDRKVEGTQKVPILGDIPILGRLFTTTRTDTHRTDLVIVITPRLVQGPNDYVPATVTPIPGGGWTGLAGGDARGPREQHARCTAAACDACWTVTLGQ